MSASTCVHCGADTAGSMLCERCTRTLVASLRAVARYHPELDVLATRQSRFGEPGKGSIGKAQPLPVDMRFVNVGGKDGGPARLAAAAVLRDHVHATLAGWCRVIREEHPVVIGPRHVACLDLSCLAIKRTHDQPLRDSVVSMCAYLDRQHRVVLASPWVGELLDQLLDAEHQLQRVVDRPADRWYAGICSARRLDYDADRGLVVDQGECDVQLYVEVGARTVTCPGCRTTHDVAAHREFLLEQAKDVLVTATEASAALVAWTDEESNSGKLASRIRQWSRRKRLLPAGTANIAGQRRSLYRLGDVQDLLVDSVRHAVAGRAR